MSVGKLAFTYDEEKSLSKASLGSGDLRSAVRLPDGDNLNDWLAVNVKDFTEQIMLIHESIRDNCTEEKCAVMSAGSKYEYLWTESTVPIKVSAPQYFKLVAEWTRKLYDDESVFPTDEKSDYPQDFQNTVKTIFKRLFRLYAHVYYSHTMQLRDLGVEAHLNTAFKHFYLFIREFDLVQMKDMEPLKEAIAKINELYPKSKK